MGSIFFLSFFFLFNFLGSQGLCLQETVIDTMFLVAEIDCFARSVIAVFSMGDFIWAVGGELFCLDSPPPFRPFRVLITKAWSMVGQFAGSRWKKILRGAFYLQGILRTETLGGQSITENRSLC
ncbi:hypothetical protein F5890DRAFT_1503708 [Lentinula detonsa]|uniref:Secreted protein n=1 Tax=Lentinula detonsa TaxID=2804962 RepID=A0AA38Q470_9AGAR|nr:hypothetical protein F5890DRAFT_1503708 [Lentinula detonsa]